MSLALSLPLHPLVRSKKALEDMLILVAQPFSQLLPACRKLGAQRPLYKWTHSFPMAVPNTAGGASKPKPTLMTPAVCPLHRPP